MRPKTLEELETYLSNVALGNIKRYSSGRAGSIQKWEVLIATVDEVFKDYMGRSEDDYRATEQNFVEHILPNLYCSKCRLCMLSPTMLGRRCRGCPLDGEDSCDEHFSWGIMTDASSIREWKIGAEKFLAHIKKKTARRKKK